MKHNSNTIATAQLRAVAYTRFSSTMQSDGNSIEAQLSAVRAYAKGENMTLVGEYIDRAKSAVTDDRPEFLRMIEDAKNNKFEVVIVHKLDRFARNRYHSAMYKQELKKCNVRLRSVTEPLDDSPESIMLEALLEGMAEYYSRNLGRETMKGLAENAKKGMSTGGPPPFGFRTNPETKKLELHETEAKGVKLIFDMILQGHSYREVITELNEQGYKTRSGRPFVTTSLYSILRNEKYRGCYIFNKSASKDMNGKRNGHHYKNAEDVIRVEDGCPRIVSNEDFFAVQKKMNTRQHPKSHAVYKETYLLTGKVYCGLCGSTYIGSRRKKGSSKSWWAYYGCGQQSRNKVERCSNKVISRDHLEGVVLDNIAKTVFSEAMIPKLTEAYNEYLKGDGSGNKELTTLKRRLAKLNSDVDYLVEALLEHKSNSLFSKLDKLEDKKQELEAKIYQMQLLKPVKSVSEQDIAKAFEQIRKKLLSGKLENVRQIIEVYVDRIEVYPDRAVVQFNYMPKVTLPRLRPPNNAKIKEESSNASKTNELSSTKGPKNMGHFGGEGGIRTHGCLRITGFQDRHFQPDSDTSPNT